MWVPEWIKGWIELLQTWLLTQSGGGVNDFTIGYEIFWWIGRGLHCCDPAADTTEWDM